MKHGLWYLFYAFLFTMGYWIGAHNWKGHHYEYIKKLKKCINHKIDITNTCIYDIDRHNSYLRSSGIFADDKAIDMYKTGWDSTKKYQGMTQAFKDVLLDIDMCDYKTLNGEED